MTKKKIAKTEAGIQTIKGARGKIGEANAMIIFGGRTLAEAQEKLFDYVDERRPIICELDLRDFARQKGYTWMSGEFMPTGQYLMRFRGQDVATFSAVGVTPSEAEDKARLVLKCVPDAKAAA